METKRRFRRTKKASRKTARHKIEVGVPSNTYKAKEIIAASLNKLLKEFISIYDYGPCIMVGFQGKDVFVYWKHWQKVNWRDSPKVYLGKIKHEQPTNHIYLWLE